MPVITQELACYAYQTWCCCEAEIYRLVRQHYLSYVLDDELPSIQVLPSEKAKAFGSCAPLHRGEEVGMQVNPQKLTLEHDHLNIVKATTSCTRLRSPNSETGQHKCTTIWLCGLNYGQWCRHNM